MRSKTAQRISDNTTEELKERVRNEVNEKVMNELREKINELSKNIVRGVYQELTDNEEIKNIEREIFKLIQSQPINKELEEEANDAESMVRSVYCNNDKTIDLSEFTVSLDSTVSLMNRFKNQEVNKLFSLIGELIESIKK